MGFLPVWIQKFLPILALLLVVVVVLARLPKVELGHSAGFLRRRRLNWVPLGLTYAFLYMGRYNLIVAQNAGLLSKHDLGTIKAIGDWVYGLSFLLNGPLTDRLGGRKTILISAIGAAIANLVIGFVVVGSWDGASLSLSRPVLLLGLLYAANMYFQSFGAVSIVKVNAYWFHIRERGTIGAVFGILISLGLYFAFDWGGMIAKYLPLEYVFFIPAALLVGFALVDYLVVFDLPSQVGLADFDAADASSGEDGPRLPVLEIARRMLRHPVIVTIAIIELMSGFVRGGIITWTGTFLKETQQGASFLALNNGMMQCIAGILGGVFAGVISDRLFQSRRGPSAVFLYGLLTVAVTAGVFVIAGPAFGWLMMLAIMAIIGVHGMLSGTASADFGGRKNAGVAVGLIDGMVYLGVGLQAMLLGHLLPEGAAAKDPGHWTAMPLAFLPAAVIGLLLSVRIWHARPGPLGTRAVARSSDGGAATPSSSEPVLRVASAE